MFKIDNHTVAHYIYGFVSEYSGGEQIKNEFALFVHNRMTRIVSALISANNVIAAAE